MSCQEHSRPMNKFLLIDKSLEKMRENSTSLKKIHTSNTISSKGTVDWI